MKTPRPRQDWVTVRLLSLVAAGLFLGLIAVACLLNLSSPRTVDFASFWHAGGLILRGKAEAVYAVQPSLFGDLMPLAYPPPFLFFLPAFGLMSFGLAFVVWVGATGLLYVLAAREPARLSLANPVAAYNGLIGQNGFLTASIMLFAAHSVRTRPLFGGALFGLMVIKPQLAVLVPLALAAGRYWLAFVSAALSAAVLLALSAIVFGADAFRGFFEVMPQYAAMLERGRWPWNMLASTFAFVRWFGASPAIAWVVHCLVGGFAAAMVWRSWREDWDSKIAVLAAASILISPYIFTYDSVLLVAPFAWLAARNRAWAAVMWGLLLMPLGISFRIYAGPNSIPVAALLSLVALYWINRQTADGLASLIRPASRDSSRDADQAPA